MKRTIGLLAVVSVCFGLCASTALASSNEAPGVTRVVRKGFQAQLNRKARLDQAQYPGIRFTVTGVTCIQVNNTESYRCIAYYTLRYKTYDYKYEAVINANVSGTTVLWQAGAGTRIG